MAEDRAAFIRANTALAAPPLIPEIRLYLASELTPLWQATEAALAAVALEPPFWAFAWPGGQAIARYLLDVPETVAGKRVLDLGAGSGLCAIAAAKAGAAGVTAADIDPFAAAAIALNAEANGVSLAIETGDLLDAPPGPWDIVLAGDVCYERGMSHQIVPWLREAAQAGALVLLADPGRAYLPDSGLERIGDYVVPTLPDVESADVKHTVLWRMR